MNISDYSVEGLEEVWDYVDSFFNWDITTTSPESRIQG